jgi:hypothetical protein
MAEPILAGDLIGTTHHFHVERRGFGALAQSLHALPQALHLMENARLTGSHLPPPSDDAGGHQDFVTNFVLLISKFEWGPNRCGVLGDRCEAGS